MPLNLRAVMLIKTTIPNLSFGQQWNASAQHGDLTPMLARHRLGRTPNYVVTLTLSLHRSVAKGLNCQINFKFPALARWMLVIASRMYVEGTEGMRPAIDAWCPEWELFGLGMPNSGISKYALSLTTIVQRSRQFVMAKNSDKNSVYVLHLELCGTEPDLVQHKVREQIRNMISAGLDTADNSDRALNDLINLAFEQIDAARRLDQVG